MIKAILVIVLTLSCQLAEAFQVSTDSSFNIVYEQLAKITSIGFGKTEGEAIEGAKVNALNSFLNYFSNTKEQNSNFDGNNLIPQELTQAIQSTEIGYTASFENNHFALVNTIVSTERLRTIAATREIKLNTLGRGYAYEIRLDSFLRRQELTAIKDYFKWWHSINLFDSKYQIRIPERSENIKYRSSEIGLPDIQKDAYDPMYFINLIDYTGDYNNPHKEFLFRYSDHLPPYAVKTKDRIAFSYNDLPTIFREKGYVVEVDFEFRPNSEYYSFLYGFNKLLNCLSVKTGYNEPLLGKLYRFANFTDSAFLQLLQQIPEGKTRKFYYSEVENMCKTYKLRNDITSYIKFYSLQKSRQELTPFSYRATAQGISEAPIIMGLKNFNAIIDLKESLNYEEQYFFLGQYWQYTHGDDLRFETNNEPFKATLYFGLTLDELANIDSISFTKAPISKFQPYYQEWEESKTPSQYLIPYKRMLSKASSEQAKEVFKKIYNQLNLSKDLIDKIDGTTQEASDITLSFAGYDATLDYLFFSLSPASGTGDETYRYNFNDESCKEIFTGTITVIDIKNHRLITETQAYDVMGRYWQKKIRNYDGTLISTGPKER